MPGRSKRGAAGAGNIRRRADGRWEARYIVGRDPATGKPIRKSIYGKTQGEVRKELTRVLGTLDNGIYAEPTKLTVSQWMEIWLREYVADSVKPFTLATYKTQCTRHINPGIGPVRLSALSTHTIQAFYNSLKADHGNRKALSSQSIKSVHGVLHKALKKAVELHYIQFNPSDSCTLPRIIKPEIKPLSNAEIGSFVALLDGHRYKNLFLVTLFAGLRRGEALGLTWPCVDFKNNSITINKQLQLEKKKGAQYYLSETKSGNTRVLTPGSFVMDALRDEKLKQGENRLKAGSAWANPNDLVFTNEIGSNITLDAVHYSFKKLAKAIGRDDARFHDLRHTYAVTALQEGDSIKTVQSNLGHAKATFTLDVYGHISEKMKQDSAKRMDAFIDTVTSDRPKK